MQWPPPFRSLPNPRAVFAWGVYDLANQSFQLLINSLLFPLFVVGVIVGDPERGAAAWTQMSAAGLLLVVLLSPVMGAIGDQRAWKRELLLATGAICATLTCALALLQPGQLTAAFAVYLVAAVACGLGENFLGSFLPEISTPSNVGRVSAIGWSMSYAGALMLLGLTAVVALVLGRSTPAEMRPMLVFAGLWFLVGMVPAAVWLRERALPQPSNARWVVAAACARLVESARKTRDHSQLARFFLAFAVYSAGTLTMIFGLGLIGDRLGFNLGELILMGTLIAVTAGISAAVAGRVQEAFGHLRTISLFLIVWVLTSLAMAAAELVSVPPIVYWVVAGFIGVAMGGIGTASRAIVGAFTPPDRAGEFFGLWGMIYKLAGVAGVFAFGQISARASQPAGLLVVAGLFALGLGLLWRVDENEGIRQAAAGEPLRNPLRTPV